jgi:molybdate-binding protein
MQYEELKEKIIQWGKDRNIFEYSTAIKQLLKTQEELDETMNALVQFADAKTDKQKTEAMEQIVDGIGDMGVTLMMLCHKVDVDFIECLESAYDVIKNRRGKIVDGLFCKEQ